jgi:hypothetical protein
MAAAGLKMDFKRIRTAIDSGKLLTISRIRPGDRVTILVPSGFGRNGQEYTEKTGRAVICSGDHVALNMGGKYGTPGVATVENFVRSKPERNE